MTFANMLKLRAQALFHLVFRSRGQVRGRIRIVNCFDCVNAFQIRAMLEPPPNPTLNN